MIPDVSTFVLAYVIAPAIVVALGYLAVRLHEWADDRERRSHPGE